MNTPAACRPSPSAAPESHDSRSGASVVRRPAASTSAGRVWHDGVSHCLRPAATCVGRGRSSYSSVATIRNGIIETAIAAPSPSCEPGMARWNASVAIRWVVLNGPPRVIA